jgi:hypothetical protein
MATRRGTREEKGAGYIPIEKQPWCLLQHPLPDGANHGSADRDEGVAIPPWLLEVSVYLLEATVKVFLVRVPLPSAVDGNVYLSISMQE